MYAQVPLDYFLDYAIFKETNGFLTTLFCLSLIIYRQKRRTI